MLQNAFDKMEALWAAGKIRSEQYAESSMANIATG
jgi:hypothetical protein